jgi:hypothetical protein
MINFLSELLGFNHYKLAERSSARAKLVYITYQLGEIKRRCRTQNEAAGA